MLKKLVYVGSLMSWMLLFSISQGVSKNAVDKLFEANDERRRQLADHLPFTYEIVKKLGNINPKAPVATDTQRRHIMEAVIDNALLIRSLDPLMDHYLVDTAAIASRMAYVAISAVTQYFAEGGIDNAEAINLIIQQTNLHNNDIAKSYRKLFNKQVQNFYNDTRELYPHQRYQLGLEASFSGFDREKFNRAIIRPIDTAAMPNVKGLPLDNWDKYPASYRDVLNNIKKSFPGRDVRDQANSVHRAIQDIRSILEGKITQQRDVAASLSARVIEKYGLKIDEVSGLVDMFSLVIPGLSKVWQQMKEVPDIQGALLGLNDLSAHYPAINQRYQRLLPQQTGGRRLLTTQMLFLNEVETKEAMGDIWATQVPQIASIIARLNVEGITQTSAMEVVLSIKALILSIQSLDQETLKSELRRVPAIVGIIRGLRQEYLHIANFAYSNNGRFNKELTDKEIASDIAYVDGLLEGL